MLSSALREGGPERGTLKDGDWALKERFLQLWDHAYRKAAHNFFARWFRGAIHSRLRSRAEVAKRIQRHRVTGLTYLLHGITNAGVRAVKTTIEWLKKTAQGFRNVEQFKIARYFQFRGLDLQPTYTRARKTKDIDIMKTSGYNFSYGDEMFSLLSFLTYGDLPDSNGCVSLT